MATLALSLPLTSALAQTAAWPARPIRALVAIGGGGEALGRVVAEKMSQALGQTVVIDPQPAAAGSIAAQTVARAAPDGYTLLYAAVNSQVYRTLLAKNVPYDPVRDFTPIGMMSDAVLAVATSNESGIRSIADLIARAKADEGKLFYGTSGVGTTHHLSVEVFQSVTGVRLTHVPYKDPNQVGLELMGNRIPVGWGVFGTLYQNHLSGKLRIIAINNTQRFRRTPDIPTVGEQVPGYEPPPGWNAWFGPAGLPRPIVDRLNAEINRALAAPDLRDRIDALGFIPTPGTPEDLAAELKRSLANAARVVKAAGIEPE
jgi:tripartite-type tricarboxylate transporter receptor subunit TctC